MNSSEMPSNLESPEKVGIKLLRLSCMNLTTLDPHALEKYCDLEHLEHLDVSKNQLKSIPPLSLPRLKNLNCEDNSISDVMCLLRYPSLQHLSFTGNPLNAADRFIAVDQIPCLQTLDGRPVTDIRNVIVKVEERIAFQIQFLREKKSSLIGDGINEDEKAQLQKQFVRETLHSLSGFSEVPVKYRRFKAQHMVDQVFRECPTVNSSRKIEDTMHIPTMSPHVVIEKLNLSRDNEYKGNGGALPLSTSLKNSPSISVVSSSPRKNSGQSNISEGDVSSRYLPKRTRQSVKSSFLENASVAFQHIKDKKPDHQQESSDSGRGQKEKHKLKEHEHLDYDPHLFLRCHSLNQDPHDSKISVWRSAFEPDLKDKSKTTDVVATCGGNIVCLINCNTGHVLKRYKNDNPSERLYALAWTVYPISENNQHAYTILATAGTGKKVYLIHPTMLKCYHSFKVHTQPVNTLVFHYSQQTWMFSGGDDGDIHLWDIGQPSVRDFKTSVQKLMTFEAKGAVLQILFSSLHDVLISTSSESLMIWDFKKNSIDKTSKNPMKEIHKSILCECGNGGVVDGLEFVSDDCIAVKVSGMPSIFLLKISSLLNKSKRKGISFVAQLLWASCDTSYNYLGSCEEFSLLACGDNEGRVWLYDVAKHLPHPDTSKESNDIFSPNLVLPWPKLVFQKDSLSVKEQVVINSIAFNWNGTIMVSCSDSNLVCIWKKT